MKKSSSPNYTGSAIPPSSANPIQLIPENVSKKNREPNQRPVFDVNPTPGGLFHLVERRIPRCPLGLISLRLILGEFSHALELHDCYITAP